MESVLKLEDIIPETGEFTLAQTKKTYHLRPISIADEIWLKKKFGNDQDIQKIFSEVNFVKITEIAFHQMVDEDKQDLKKQTVKFMDEKGEYIEEELGGSQLLFHMIAGWKEKKEILNALLQTIGVSRPMIEKIDKQTTEKLEQNLKKKISQPIGQESSISSITNTETQKSIS